MKKVVVMSKNKFCQIVALNFQENHASQDIQRSMHNDDHEILFVRDWGSLQATVRIPYFF